MSPFRILLRLAQDHFTPDLNVLPLTAHGGHIIWVFGWLRGLPGAHLQTGVDSEAAQAGGAVLASTHIAGRNTCEVETEGALVFDLYSLARREAEAAGRAAEISPESGADLCSSPPGASSTGLSARFGLHLKMIWDALFFFNSQR